MKKITVCLGLLIVQLLPAQISLKECIENGLKNKSKINIARAEQVIAELKNNDSKSKYLPEIYGEYENRYNTIIASQIVPIGQFSSIPTNETRATKFGTKWQQNAGITLYQPILDFTLLNRIKESKFDVTRSNIELKKVEDEINFEIVKSYGNVLTFEFQIKEAIADTSRTFKTLELVKARFKEGKILKTELNNAIINHRNNIIAWKKAITSTINEKLFLHYLTDIDLKRILGENFQTIPEFITESPDDETTIDWNTLTEIKKLEIDKQLVKQQIKTERMKYIPTIGLQGYFGANQFDNEFQFVNSNTNWFGNSYVGISLKLPLLNAEKSINASKQLSSKIKIIDFQKEELLSERSKRLKQITNIIVTQTEELKIKRDNLVLLQDNLSMYQQRFLNDQLNAIELNIQEIEIQKLKFQISQLEQQLNITKVEKLYVTGQLSTKLNSLK